MTPTFLRSSWHARWKRNLKCEKLHNCQSNCLIILSHLFLGLVTCNLWTVTSDLNIVVCLLGYISKKVNEISFLTFLRFHIIIYNLAALNIEEKKTCKHFVQRGLGLASGGHQMGSHAPDKVPLVVCITRLVPQKGLHLITHAIKYVKEIVSSLPVSRHPPRSTYIHLHEFSFFVSNMFLQAYYIWNQWLYLLCIAANI